MSELRDLLDLTAGLAADFYDTLPERPVFPHATAAELREALGGPLPEQPSDPRAVIEALAAAADPGLVAEPGGRYFGFVIGGALHVDGAFGLWAAVSDSLRHHVDGSARRY